MLLSEWEIPNDEQKKDKLDWCLFAQVWKVDANTQSALRQFGLQNLYITSIVHVSSKRHISENLF